MALSTFNLFSHTSFRLVKDQKLENLGNGREICASLFCKEREDLPLEVVQQFSISKWILGKITVPFDFQPTFHIFGLSAKHPICPLLFQQRETKVPSFSETRGRRGTSPLVTSTAYTKNIHNANIVYKPLALHLDMTDSRLFHLVFVVKAICVC